MYLGKGRAPARQGEEKDPGKFKKVSRENGISFHWLEPGKYLHIDGGRRWPRQDRGLWGGCVRNHMRATG